MNLKKALSILLATAMLTGGIVVPALAEEESEPVIVKEEKHEEEKREEREEEVREQVSSGSEEEPGQPDPVEASGGEEAPVEVEIELAPEGDSEGEDEGEKQPSESEGETGQTGEEQPPQESEGQPVQTIPGPEELPEATEVPQEPRSAEIHISAMSGDVPVGQQTGFKFKISHAASVEFRLVAPDGSTAASGSGGSGDGSYTFVPEMGGRYVMTITAISEDGSEVSASSSLTAVEVAEFDVHVKAEHPCCHAGEPISFLLELSDGVDIAECSINAYQSGTEIYHTGNFAGKVTVTPQAKNSVTKVTLAVSVTDSNGRTAESSVTIPCAVNDEESRAQWEATLSGVVLTGNWPQDLLAIARTQVGYVESSLDFGEKDDGGISGYTRYGHWAGLRYEEWCDMFACFCLHYAGIAEEYFPYASNGNRWIRKLTEKELYASRAVYLPKVGDLVFFDWEADGDCDHVGIIEALATDADGNVTGMYTIEGNSTGGAVTEGEYYDINDMGIVGYGLVNRAYENHLTGQTRTLQAEDGGITVTAVVEAGAELPVDTAMVVKGISGKKYDRKLNRALHDGDALTYARFMEIGFVDADGAAVWPGAPVSVTVEIGEHISGGSGQTPGVALVGDDGVSVSREVALERENSAASFSFEQQDFEGVIGVFTTGVLKCRRGSLKAEDGDARAQLTYAASSGVPDGSELTFREIGQGDSEYAELLAKLDDVPGDAEVRFFEIGLERNGVDYNLDDTAQLEITCRQQASDAKVVCIEDGRTLRAELTQRKNDHCAVKVNANTLGIYALITGSAGGAR